MRKAKDKAPVVQGDIQLQDFRNFLYVTWKHLGLPEPTPVQYDIAHYLQTGGKRIIVEGFRGVGKSWITAAFVCHQLYLDPQKKILVISASKALADNFSTFVLQLIHGMPELEHLIPEDNQRNSKIQFDVKPATAAKDPSVRSVGITGQITGSRADLIVADDVEVPGNAMTQMLRDKLSEAVKEFDAILTPKEDSRIVFLGTPQCEQSLYNALPGRGFQVRVWPARYPNVTKVAGYNGTLAPFIANALAKSEALAGKPTDPKRFSEEDLLEREASYGRSGFSLQFMLDTRLSDLDRYPLRVNDLIVMDLDEEEGPEKVTWSGTYEFEYKDLPSLGFNGDRFHRPQTLSQRSAPYTGGVMFIDPAGRGKDEVGYAVVKMLHGQLFVLACGGIQGGYQDSNLEFLSNIAKVTLVNHVIIEKNFGDGMFSKLLTPFLAKVHPCRIEEVHSSIQKEKRIIDTLEPVMNRHKLIFNRKVIQDDYEGVQKDLTERAPQRSLIYQLTRITREKGALLLDDRLDALAGAVAYWVESMARDTDLAVQERSAELLDQELNGFLEHATGIEGFGVSLGGDRDGWGGTWSIR